jgi:hypothetical protein
MVSPQQTHTMVRPLSSTRGKRSMAGFDGVSCGMCVSTEQAGAHPDSQPPTPGTGPLSVMTHM